MDGPKAKLTGDGWSRLQLCERTVCETSASIDSVPNFGRLQYLLSPQKQNKHTITSLLSRVHTNNMSTSNLFLFKNGVVCSSTDTPPITTLLESHPGAYTTTRTINDVSKLLFWDRHLRRLCNSARILLSVKPEFMFQKPIDSTPFGNNLEKWGDFDEVVCSLVDDSMSRALEVVLGERVGGNGEELAITALVCGSYGDLGRFGRVEEFDEEIILGVFDVYVHVSGYFPPVFGVRGRGANLAVVGSGRDVANAKYSDWVRLRKPLEKMRAPSVSELLLSDNGDRILEGCLTNFFVVCLKDQSEGETSENLQSYELQTAPLDDGVLPGVAREVIVDICLENGIPIREVAPLWSQRDLWTEAFISNSLRLIQHAEKVDVPSPWDTRQSHTWKSVKWENKMFLDAPGKITSVLQNLVMEKANHESHPLQ